MATSVSICERALCELERRLKRIRIEGGFQTDAGKNVFRARRTVDEARLPAVVLWDEGETVDNGGGTALAYMVKLTVSVDGLVVANTDDTGRVLEALKADIKRALLTGAKGHLSDGDGDQHKIGTLSYLSARATPREDGANSESLSLSFLATYPEAYGNPNSTQQEIKR